MALVQEVYEPAHLEFLEDNRAEIPMAGGLWVFEVGSRQRAIELIEADPNFKTNPRKYRLLAWGKALPQYQVRI